MTIKTITAKTLLRKNASIDSWFLARYGMNLYRGCMHNCAYCDGRAEKYNVEGNFGEELSVKINAPELLARELQPTVKRKPLKKGFVLIGGGVGDSYQLPEKDYLLARKVLEILRDRNYPVHVLTKSTLVERDKDILLAIHQKKRAIVSFSFSTVDETIASVFEPSVCSPCERLNTLSNLKKTGLNCGVYYMPVIPFISDSEKKMEEALLAFKHAGADFVIFGGMTLKAGRQKEYFMDILEKTYPDKIKNYEKIYGVNKWGNASGNYYNKINQQFFALAKKHKLPVRMPPYIFSGMISENDKVVTIFPYAFH